MMAGMIVAFCLFAVLSFVMSAVVSCDAWRNVGDVLCLLAILVGAMVVVLVFTVWKV